MAPADRERVREAVAARYASLARAAQAGEMITDGDPDVSADCAAVYPDAGDLPEAAVRASLGCGNPVAVADLRPGEIVLDLGSGGGIDVLLSARRVGPAGKAYGLARAGFTGITITPTQRAGEGVHSAIIRAVKP